MSIMTNYFLSVGEWPIHSYTWKDFFVWMSQDD